jgi:phosphomannomutase
MTLRIASFGIRGFVGESLTPKAVMDFACAFGTFAGGGRVLVGRDTRYSSPMLHAAVVSSLLSCGCEVLDFGVCPTPLLQFSARPCGAAGAVSIGGGHNGMGWNALTLIGPDGAFLEPVGGETVLDIFHAGDFLKADSAHMWAAKLQGAFAESYFKALAAHLNADAIRACRFTVLIDPVGGAGCPFLETFAAHLGVRLVAINAQPSGYLAREPEPRPRSALQMASFIRHVQGDIGFVLSSDMGRLSVVTELGEPASEEYTFPLVARHVLDKRPGPVVTNCCTTRTIDDIAAARGLPLVRTPVGQAYILSALADELGVIGGEGSGSCAVPAFSRAFDGFLMMGLLLEAMAERRAPVSALLGELPRYHIVKRRLPIAARRAYQALDAFRDRIGELGAGARLEFTDGIRADWEDGWLHVRPSHTEQVMRVISESSSRATAEARAESAFRIIGPSAS